MVRCVVTTTKILIKDTSSLPPSIWCLKLVLEVGRTIHACVLVYYPAEVKPGFRHKQRNEYNGRKTYNVALITNRWNHVYQKKIVKLNHFIVG
jgi:hypothetical protein